MDKISFITVEEEEHAIIEHEDGSVTSMPKAVWDALNVDSEGNK